MLKCQTPSLTKSHSNRPLYSPTLANIRAACAKIQRAWSPEERAERRMSHGGFAVFHVQFLPGSDHPVRAGAAHIAPGPRTAASFATAGR
jgi:hypothetical protein